MSKLKKEFTLFLKAVLNTRFGTLTKKHILKELLINGVALLVTLLISGAVHNVLSGYIREKNNVDRVKETLHYEQIREKVGVLKRLERPNRDERIVLEKDEISNLESWVSGLVVFIVGLFVFTYVEAVMERFLSYREEGAVS